MMFNLSLIALALYMLATILPSMFITSISFALFTEPSDQMKSIILSIMASEQLNIYKVSIRLSLIVLLTSFISPVVLEHTLSS